MAQSLAGQLVVAISSRALFDFEEENRVFVESDDRAYMRLQLERSEQPAKPGVAFNLVRKLLAFNTADVKRVEVVILSRNDPVSGLRVIHSARHFNLGIQRCVFTRGESPFGYLRPLNANLFLSANAADVRAALEAGYPAARVSPEFLPSLRPAQMPEPAGTGRPNEVRANEVRIAFDGDAVIFSDEAERVFQAKGLDAFQTHEQSKATQPLPGGPFKPLLEALHRLQTEGVAGTAPMRIRTALVTARSAPAHERAIRTLMAWNIEVDEAMFLGGLDKGEFLREFEADFFFDDQVKHVESAAAHVPAGHVDAGIVNL